MHNKDILDFAISRESNEIIDICDALRGQLCDCLCPECRRPVIARKGPKRRHHFSHRPSDQMSNPCEGGPETGLHLAAKKIIAGWKDITLPPLIYKARERLNIEANAELPADHFPVDSSVLPDEVGWNSDWIPDVVLRGPKGEVRIEIKVTHGINRTKFGRIERDAIRTLEFDLSTLDRNSQWTLSSLENELRNSPAIIHWVFHPQFQHLKERARRHLQEKLATPTKNNIPDCPVFGEGTLVFHPWLGLIPSDPAAREAFIANTYQEPVFFDLPGASLLARHHPLTADSWMISIVSCQCPGTRRAPYDALLSEHLDRLGLRSVYFGIANVRIVRGTEAIVSFKAFADQQAIGMAPH